MKLTRDQVPAFLRFFHPDDVEVMNRRLLARENLDGYFLDPTGAAWIESQGPERFRLAIVGSPAPSLLAEGRDAAWEKGAVRIDLRLKPSPISAGLPVLGFRLRHVRLEFLTPLAELPSNEGSPLSWSTVSIDKAAEVLERAAEGDPDHDPDDGDARSALESWLSDTALTHGPECVQVSEAGIVIAQVQSRTGWSRITYMGLLPEFRGRGLGKWVHRHGFSMMRCQGGVTYQGGTADTNRPMVRLFEAHGCRPMRRLEEWKATRA